MAAAVERPAPRQLAPPWVELLAISVVCVAVYANTLDVPFVFDDISSIVENRHIRLDEISWEELRRAAFDNPSPRPLASMTFALNHAFGGYDVRSYHVVNIAIHLATSWVVFLLASTLFARLRPQDPDGARNLSLLAALVFTAHPIQTQAVTYVVQRMTSLAALFYLLAVLAYLKGRTADVAGRRWALWASAAVSGLLAFGAKQIAITLPFALLLIEWHFFRDASRAWLQRQIAPLLGFLALCAVAAAIYLIGFEPPLPNYAEQDFTMGERLLTQLRVVVFYLGLLVFPHPERLNLSHAFPISHSLLDPPSTLLAGAFLLLLVSLAWVLRRRERLLSFAILWLFLNLLLESTVLPLALVFEHRLYLPMFGFALLVADGAGRLGRSRRTPTMAIGMALVLLLGAGTFLRNEVWRDTVVFWTDAVTKSPLDDRAHYNLALAYAAKGAVEATERQYREVLRLNPSYADALNGLGIISEARGEIQRALDYYAAANEIAPHVPVYATNRALLLAREGDLEVAARALDQIVRSHPEHANGHYALGHVRESRGHIESAKRLYQRTLEIESDHGDAQLRLAILLAREGDIAQALHHAQEATRLQPEQEEARLLFEALRREAAR